MLLAFALIQAAVTTPAPAATPQPVRAQEEQVCKRIKQAGSNLAKKVCLTPYEWAMQASNGRDKVATANRPF